MENKVKLGSTKDKDTQYLPGTNCTLLSTYYASVVSCSDDNNLYYKQLLGSSN